MPPVYWDLWLRQRIQGPSGLEAATTHVTVPLSTAVQTDAMSAGRAVRTSGPARGQSQGKLGAARVSGLHFTAGGLKLGVTANLDAASVQTGEKRVSLPSVTFLLCI